MLAGIIATVKIFHLKKFYCWDNCKIKKVSFKRNLLAEIAAISKPFIVAW